VPGIDEPEESAPVEITEIAGDVFVIGVDMRSGPAAYNAFLTSFANRRGLYVFCGRIFIRVIP